MTPSSPGRWALPVSLLLVVATWAMSIATLFRAKGPAALPSSVGMLAVYIALKTGLAVAVVGALLFASDERFESLGLTAPFLKAALKWGPLVAAAIFLVTNVFLGGLLKAVGIPDRPEALPGLFRDPREAPLWAFVAIVGGGFTEELIRSFVLTRFEKAFGRPGLVFAFVVDTAAFGLGHLYQGVRGAIQAAVTGLFFGVVFLKRRRAADSMVVHAIFDLLGVALAYCLYAGRP